MIIHSSAVVLRCVDYSESSKIVTLFTEDHGKVAVMARGCRKPKSSFSGLLEPGNLLDVVYYHKDSRSVQTLSEASFLEKTLNIRTDVGKMAVLISLIELAGQLLHEAEVNRPMFDFLRHFIPWLDNTDQNVYTVFPYLQIRLINLIGLGLQLDETVNKDQNNTYFINIDSGLVAAYNTSGRSLKLSSNQYRYLALALSSRSAALLDFRFEPEELKELIQYLDRYLKFHVEGLRDRKSDSIFEQLLQSPS